MFEIQKVEELKQEIDKSKSLKEYISKEIEEMEERLQNIESENKQNLIEYKIKKQELEKKLLKLKNEMLNEEALNQEERNKYSQIENDLKNKISFVSLQNSNIAGGSTNDETSDNYDKIRLQEEIESYNKERNRKLNERNRNRNQERNINFIENSNRKSDLVEADVKTEKKNFSNLRNTKSISDCLIFIF